MRLIGGRLRRSKLPVPDSPGLRPTPDRVRETLFNWLGQDLSGWRVLDAFAGSGALGLEAVSRGAVEAVLLERDPALAAGLRATCARLQAGGVRIEATDALRWMRAAAPGRFDIVFLDPPFDTGLHAAALRAAVPLIAPDGMVYVESGAEIEPSELSELCLDVWRSGRAGVVHYCLLRHGPTRSDDPCLDPSQFPQE